MDGYVVFYNDKIILLMVRILTDFVSMVSILYPLEVATKHKALLSQGMEECIWYVYGSNCFIFYMNRYFGISVYCFLFSGEGSWPWLTSVPAKLLVSSYSIKHRRLCYSIIIPYLQNLGKDFVNEYFDYPQC